VGARAGTLTVIGVTVAAGAFLGSALSQHWRASEVAVEAPTQRVSERVRVEVLNGSGKSGLARGATDLLREGGFDVVYFGNAKESGLDSSVVLDRVGRVDMARAVADALGIRSVASAPDSNLYLDVTVMLGAEWSRPNLAPTPVSAPLPWWSPKRWFPKPESTGANPTGPVANPKR
jgi:hypothetical protein